MTPSSFLLSYFDRLAEAPGGIAKLRELILRLAMDGKILPPQQAAPDPSDVEWPKRPLGSVASLITKGSTPTSYGHQYESTGIPFVKVENINDGVIQHSLIGQFISDATHKFLKRSQLESGDVLFSIAGTIGKTCIVGPNDVPANTNQALAIIRGVDTSFEPAFLKLQLDSFVANEVRAKARGGAMPNVSLGDLRDLIVVIPPLAEQRRIVAKVEELMGLCDALEAAQQEREAVRTRLRTSALHQLASPDSDTNSASFVLKNISLFATVTEDLGSLRESVLQLAVQGKLVHQDTNDEPADRLLLRTRSEKAKKVSLGTIRKPRSNEDPFVAAPDLGLPVGWAPGCVADFGAPEDNAIVDGPFGSNLLLSDYDSQGTYPVITISNIDEGFDLASLRKVSEQKYQELKRSSVRANDILVAKIGSSYGKVGLYPAHMPVGIIPANLLKITPNQSVDWRYLVIALRSQLFKDELENIVQVTAQPAFGVSKFKLLPIAVPPLAEQRRIVAKVDELMAVLDALEATLTTARTTSVNLLAATIAKLHAA